MKAKSYLLVVVFFLFMAGCQTNGLYFSGESTNWKAEVFIQQITKDQEEATLVLKYQGKEDISSLGQFEYFVKLPKHGFGGTAQLNDAGIYEGNSGLSNGKTYKDNEIEVSVRWNGKTERFILKTKE
jgi:hypothetical protein